MSARFGLSVTLDTARRIRFQQHPTLTACWIWTGAISSNGKATATFQGVSTTARSAVYRQLRGDPEGQLWTQCGNTLCVNPNHMEIQ